MSFSRSPTCTGRNADLGLPASTTTTIKPFLPTLFLLWSLFSMVCLMKAAYLPAAGHPFIHPVHQHQQKSPQPGQSLVIICLTFTSLIISFICFPTTLLVLFNTHIPVPVNTGTIPNTRSMALTTTTSIESQCPTTTYFTKSIL